MKRTVFLSNIIKTIGLFFCVAWKVLNLNDYCAAVGIVLLLASWYVLKYAYEVE